MGFHRPHGHGRVTSPISRVRLGNGDGRARQITLRNLFDMSCHPGDDQRRWEELQVAPS